jgi:hypothetical protein
MIRHTTLVFAAVAILASSALTTGTSARPAVHGHHVWHGAPWGFVAPALIGLAAAPLAYAYGYGCYIRHERVVTPWGWRWRPVEVCY